MIIDQNPNVLGFYSLHSIHPIPGVHFVIRIRTFLQTIFDIFKQPVFFPPLLHVVNIDNSIKVLLR